MTIKGVSHLHTVYSYDGKLTLRELKDLLIKRGIHVALITEHTDTMSSKEGEAFIAECRKESGGDILLIPGFEVPYKNAHILMIGAERFVKGGTDITPTHLSMWKQNAKIAILAHPHRNNYVLDDAMQNVIDGVEVWNSQYDGKFTPRFKALALLASLRQKKRNMLAWAGLDLHREEHFGGPLIVMDDIDLSYDNVMNALRNGHFSLRSKNTVVDAAGNILSPSALILSLKSGISICIVTALKNISRFFAFLHLPVPKRLRQRIRSKI